MTDTRTIDVIAVATELRDYATHFSPRDWDYTRDLGNLVAIRTNDPYDQPRSRLKRALMYLFGRTGLVDANRWRMIRVALRRDKHLPDGVLDGGTIITHWEETGEYLQYVQPTVGALIADWLTAEPCNPHACAVATEMRRIQDAYHARLMAARKDDAGE